MQTLSRWVGGGYSAAALLFSLPLFSILQKAFSALGVWDFGSFQKHLFTLLFNSFTIVAVTTTLSVSIGFLLAFLVVKTDLPGKRFWEVVFVLPLGIPSYIGAIAYISLLAPKAILSDWLGRELWNIYGADGVIFILTLFTFPYSFLICRSQLKKMGAHLEESAFDLGADRFRTIMGVFIPLCRPALFSSALLAGLYVLADFGTIALLRFNTLTTAVFYQLNSFHRENAALLGLFLFLLALAGVCLRDYLLEKNHHESLTGKTEAVFVYPLGSVARALALVFAGLLFFLSVALPLATLSYYLFTEEVDFTKWWAPCLNTFLMAFALAFSLVLSGPFVSYGLKVWGNHFGAKLFRKIAFSLYGIPSILLALGVIFVAQTALGRFYGTVIPLAVGLFIRFFPQGLEAMSWGQKSLGQNLLDASFDLGHGYLSTLRRVFLPLLKGSVASAFLLVFVSVLKELPMPLLLRPPGMEILSVQLWIDASEGLYGQASLYGLMIVVLSMLATPLILKRY
ncbi:MAG: iron ABC transporter permease [Bacteriovoracales bacterium]|nr:iron ABC transporter permease [Bacteriovoracales bacterium]